MITTADIRALRPVAGVGPALDSAVQFRGVSTDSRTTAPGELFFALRGDRFDGHAFVGAAFRRGAAAAIVDIPAVAGVPPDATLVVVPDTLRALGALASVYRRRFAIPVLAVAGSNGKTTTKEMAAAVLQSRFHVLCSEGNFNNEVGVPLTLFRLRADHQVAVLELGSNHPGEMRRLCAMTRPTHGLVTNIGREHLEFFTSIAGVVREEGTLFRILRNSGTIFVNVDDPHLVKLARGSRRRVTFGFTRRARVQGYSLSADENGNARFHLRTGAGAKAVPVCLGFPGAHNAENALAAAAVGVSFGVPVRSIRRVLEEFTPVAKRMEVTRLNGVLVLNDTYNANPDSVRAALRTLASLPVSGKRFAVLADMKELGVHSDREHERVHTEAAHLGIDYLLTFGDAMGRGSGKGGPMVVLRYDQKNMLAEELAELLSPGDAVLVKGSRSMGMEDVVTFLLERLRMQKG